MNYSYEQRQDRLRSLSPVLRDLYEGASGGRVLKEVFLRYQLRAELYAPLTLVFGDIILGFEERAKMPQLLAERLGLPNKLAELIAHDLIEHIDAGVGSTAAQVKPAVMQVQKVNAPIQSATPPRKVSKIEAPASTSRWSTEASHDTPSTSHREEEIHEEDRPFYPRVPNYSKPMTDAQPRAPQTPRTTDPYHEPT